MNQRINNFVLQARQLATSDTADHGKCFDLDRFHEKFAELIVKETLDAVNERAYYTGDRNWSDELDRQWVELEFGMGPLADAQRKAGFRHE